jgi:hypothetical protein
MAMDKQKTDDDEEPDAGTEDSGPLGTYLEHEAARPADEAETAEARRPRPRFDPRTGASDYAEGTREHEDDREQ